MFFGKLCQAASAERFHDPYRNAALLEHLELCISLLERQIQIIQLHLAELHPVAVLREKPLSYIKAAVHGKSQMLYPAVLLLLPQIIHYTVAFVEILLDIHLAYIMEEIKIKILHPALLQLFLEYLFYLVHIGKIVSGEFIRKIEALSRICAQRLAHRQLRIAAVIPPRGVVVIYALFHGIRHHLFHLVIVDFSVVTVEHRQSHRAHSERRKLFPLKILIYHSSLRFYYLRSFFPAAATAEAAAATAMPPVLLFLVSPHFFRHVECCPCFRPAGVKRCVCDYLRDLSLSHAVFLCGLQMIFK